MKPRASRLEERDAAYLTVVVALLLAVLSGAVFFLFFALPPPASSGSSPGAMVTIRCGGAGGQAACPVRATLEVVFVQADGTHLAAAAPTERVAAIFFNLTAVNSGAGPVNFETSSNIKALMLQPGSLSNNPLVTVPLGGMVAPGASAVLGGGKVLGAGVALAVTRAVTLQFMTTLFAAVATPSTLVGPTIGVTVGPDAGLWSITNFDPTVKEVSPSAARPPFGPGSAFYDWQGGPVTPGPLTSREGAG